LDRPSLVWLLAKAIVRPGGQALLINSDNSSSGWVPIEEAVRSGAAFAVDVRAGILAIDADYPDGEARLHAVAQELRPEGLLSVIVSSGRPGHAHLFAVCGPTTQRWTDRAKGLGLDVRPTIRPPLAPHRLGLPVTLLDPVTEAEALCRLWMPEEPRHALSERMQALLEQGDIGARYPSRSEVEAAIALEAANRRWAYADFRSAITSPTNRGGAKAQEIGRTRGTRAQEAYLQRTWLNAVLFSQRHPAVPGRPEAFVAIQGIRDLATEVTWGGRPGRARYQVLLALLDIAERVGSLEFSASIRRIAEQAGVGKNPASSALQWLQVWGWLRRLPQGARKTSRWQVSRPPLEKGTVKLIPPSDGIAIVPVSRGVQGHDAFGRGGLNYLVWSRLHLEEPKTAGELVRMTGLALSSVYRALARMRAYQVAISSPGGWLRLERALDEIARELGLWGMGTRRRERHQHERRVHRIQTLLRQNLLKWAEDPSDGAIFLLHGWTGELVDQLEPPDEYAARRFREGASETKITGEMRQLAYPDLGPAQAALARLRLEDEKLLGVPAL
jgi:hypothetical protein